MLAVVRQHTSRHSPPCLTKSKSDSGGLAYFEKDISHHRLCLSLVSDLLSSLQDVCGILSTKSGLAIPQIFRKRLAGSVIQERRSRDHGMSRCSHARRPNSDACRVLRAVVAGDSGGDDGALWKRALSHSRCQGSCAGFAYS